MGLLCIQLLFPLLFHLSRVFLTIILFPIIRKINRFQARSGPVRSIVRPISPFAVQLVPIPLNTVNFVTRADTPKLKVYSRNLAKKHWGRNNWNHAFERNTYISLTRIKTFQIIWRVLFILGIFLTWGYYTFSFYFHQFSIYYVSSNNNNSGPLFLFLLQYHSSILRMSFFLISLYPKYCKCNSTEIIKTL